MVDWHMTIIYNSYMLKIGIKLFIAVVLGILIGYFCDSAGFPPILSGLLGLIGAISLFLTSLRLFN